MNYTLHNSFGTLKKYCRTYAPMFPDDIMIYTTSIEYLCGDGEHSEKTDGSPGWDSPGVNPERHPGHHDGQHTGHIGVDQVNANTPVEVQLGI